MVKVKVIFVHFNFKGRGSFNHPMVKVKGRRKCSMQLSQRCFNHPMVKVKVYHTNWVAKVLVSFNHPMVKVKVAVEIIGILTNEFQPPYGES